jgi:DNA-binding SARP family transcriptional activator
VLRVQLLGEITAVRDGEPVPLSAPHRRLLAYLALHPGPHDRDGLAARFWPDASTARACLRTALWTLRQALGPDALVTSRTTVELGPFENDLDDADRDGELCDGLADDWAEVARAGHRNRRIARLDELTAAAESPAVAASWAARRCALTPLDEPAHCVLIERLAAAGDRAGALVVGRDLAARLRAELGVAPGPPVRALLAGLRGRPLRSTARPA